nr:MAG TPA: hypothetical protein [Bacteriophage sp.]
MLYFICVCIYYIIIFVFCQYALIKLISLII